MNGNTCLPHLTVVVDPPASTAAHLHQLLGSSLPFQTACRMLLLTHAIASATRGASLRLCVAFPMRSMTLPQIELGHILAHRDNHLALYSVQYLANAITRSARFPSADDGGLTIVARCCRRKQVYLKKDVTVMLADSCRHSLQSPIGAVGSETHQGRGNAGPRSLR
jgi:hypothetical protein